MNARAAVLSIVLAGPLLLAGCSALPGSAATPSPTAAVVKGSMTLTSGAYLGTSPCYADDGFSDVATGSEVDVVDGSNKVLAVGNLEDGVETASGCEFDFTIADVPNGEKLYGVKVGNGNRGVVHFSKAQLFSGGAALSLGQ